ncbi:T9SS type A sorting domain-containing protein [Reichenbachiella carrageenanivorans]|uniref:T9SS type A sorting domain-containing protein n=1 Tax=Reichenbachiella carrageenanivorans TaxID=2979869 RepID=A0ABY6D450_9BACT|nr:T9SS type A sorting domain-containing protein [Reichenbachiella carrageenanivorans]UXX80921.1 T9SS type A sorting domain-containing protein [Reichenbachiella carrageenanivorans]
MKLLSLITGLLLTILTTKAQDLIPCGATPTQKQMQQIDQRTRMSQRSLSTEIQMVAISAHIIRNTTGTEGLSQVDLMEALDNVNVFYAKANMQFYIIGNIHYIDDDRYYDFQQSDEYYLGIANDIENTINIYFTNSVSSGDNTYCGYAHFSGGPDRILMANICAINGSTLPHELGHFFDLYHTHGISNDGSSDELVDGSNCTTAGDRICDTPADPNLSDAVDNSCNYTGTALDANAQAYSPDTRNIMSYSLKQCRTQFSDDQYTTIANTYATARQYLLSEPLDANFKVSSSLVCEGSSTSFTDKSIAASSWSWQFPGGTPQTSDVPNPKVTYATAGHYNVTLTITDEDDNTDTKTITELIEVVSRSEKEPALSLTTGFELSDETVFSIQNNDGGYTFQVTSVASSTGSHSILMDFANYNKTGEEDYLILDDLSITKDKTYRLSFDRAYAYYDVDYKDSLAIVTAESCSDEWEVLYAWTHKELATTLPKSSSFVPKSSEWENDQILFTFDASWDHAKVAFKSINGYGNNLYLDEIQLEVVDTDLEIQDIITYCSSTSTNGSVEVLASATGALTYSADGQNYQTSNLIQNLPEGEYSLYIKEAEDLVSVNTFEIQTSNNSLQITTDPNGNFVVSTELSDLQWYKDGLAIDDATTDALAYQGGGVYHVTGTSQAGCSVKSDQLVITHVAEELPRFSIYPNPATTDLFINTLSLGSVVYAIFNLSGEILREGLVQASDTNGINISNLNAGIYVLQIYSGQNIAQYKFQKI